MTEIVIYGRGKTGKGLKKMSEKLGKSSCFYDDEMGFDEGGFDKNTLVVVSPGVKPCAKGLQLASQSGAQIVSELDFCFPFCKAPCISVTGTNGKTTTCRMIFHILQHAGRKARLLGNGGVPFSSEVLEIAPEEIVVLESSSFQLQNSKKFSPYISVVTNVAPDHLDYHGSFSEYVSAKRNNFCRQSANSFSVFNADDVGSMQLSFQSPSRALFYSVSDSKANCFFAEKQVCLNCLGCSEAVHSEFLSSLPKHNLSNALSAILVCFLSGISVDKSCEALQTYVFLPHRLQTVAKFHDVVFVDDSKATNVHATLSAVECFANIPIALILGGSDKGCEFDEIFSSLQPNVRMVCAVGETAQKIAACGQKFGVVVTVCPDYETAVEICYRKMKNIGGVVLMSNACASFDMFGGYAERGDRFARIVEELCREEKKN